MLTVQEYRALLRGLPKDFYLWQDRRSMYKNQRLEVVLNDGTLHTVKKNVFKDGLDAAGGWEYSTEYLEEDGSAIKENQIRAFKLLN